MTLRLPTSSVALLVAATTAACAPRAPERHLDRGVLQDKVRGGWAGQMIGVAYGAPTEFQWNGRIVEGEIEWSPERLAETIDQDDLYVEMTFAQVMDTIGLDASTEQYGDAFRDSEYWLAHANARARLNLVRGIRAPMSSHPKYNIHAGDIDFQIEADFIGLMCPGLPQEANHYADRVGRVINHGDGLYGGMFVSGMYAAAFFESAPRPIVEAGLASIPAESGYGRIIADVLAWHAEHPGDWKTNWSLLEGKWNTGDLCPDGAFDPVNIDARLNGAYVALGLLYGEGDFAKTLEISTRAGQDSDCNPSSAAGVLGVALGYDAIPDQWTSGIPAMADEKFSFTEYSFNDIVASTLSRVEGVVGSAGGRVTDTEIVVPMQAAVEPPLEQWDADPPIRRVERDDPAWEWKGGWEPAVFVRPWDEWPVTQAAGPGSEVSLTFEGTGLAFIGGMTPAGGRADVYVDGEKSDLLFDAWCPERTFENVPWHVAGLPPGEHTVRVVVTGEADERATGDELQIQAAVVYGPAP